MTALQIIYRDPQSLKPNPKNARQHSDAQVRKIAKSIERFGFNSPVLIDGQGEILCGHGRAEASKRLGLTSIPTVRLDHMTAAERRAYVIADNKLSDESEFDREIVAMELQELLDLDLGFEITDTGFEVAEIDVLIDELHQVHDPEERAPPELDSVPPIARRGDLWALGKHLLFCGDALDPLSYRVLMGGALARMVITDPPFNCPIAGHVTVSGKAAHDFAMAKGEMTPAEFRAFLKTACQNMADVSMAGSLHFIFQDWRQLGVLLSDGSEVYTEQKNLCVWNKQTGSMGSLWRSQHELIAVYKLGTEPHVNNVELGRHGRYRTNVWSYPGMSGFQKDRAKKLASHPTIKNSSLIADAILDCSNPGDIILDGFIGSGTLFLACERTNRRGYGIELEPRYADVALHRFRDATGIEPVNLWTGTMLPPRKTGGSQS